jgi:cephalosporin-C deacetylase-like acetyl esterase
MVAPDVEENPKMQTAPVKCGNKRNYIWIFWVFLVVCVVSPSRMRAGQDKTLQNTNAAGNMEAPKKHPPEIAENWAKLDDITTGLQPRPPFEVQKDEEPEFVREFIRLQWRPSDPIDLWLMRPKTNTKIPVVIYLYSFPDESERFRDDAWCRRVTAGGFAAVSFASALTGQRYHNRPMKQWFISELEEALGSSVHDLQLILNYLQDRGDLDTEHVGVFGMGSGGSIAILAAYADPRIKAVDVLDPWGDWPDWLDQSPAVPGNERPKFTTHDFLNSVAPLDPTAYLPVLKSPKIRVQQTLTDPITPKLAKESIASALSVNAQLVRYANPEEHLNTWQVGGLSGWIKEQLRSQPEVMVGTQQK